MPLEIYKQMIISASAYIDAYSGNLKIVQGMTIQEFREAHPKIIDRAFNKVISVHEYELSYEQMNRAIHIYMSSNLRSQEK